MNNAGNTIPKQPISCFINQTERALSALLPPLRLEIISALQQEDGLSAFELANFCETDVDRIIAHINKLIKYRYVYAESNSFGLCYYLKENKIAKIDRAFANFFNR